MPLKLYHSTHLILGLIIVKKPFNKMTVLDIEEFYHKIISDFYITNKELINMKIILKNMLHYADKLGIIQDDPFNTVEIITSGCRPPTKHKKESRIYSNAEIEKMLNALHEEVLQFEGCTDMHGIYFLFLDIEGRTKIREFDNRIENYVEKLELKKNLLMI